LRPGGEVLHPAQHRHINYTLGQLARWINPIVRGWMQYYGAFYRSGLYPVLKRINGYLVRWLRKKYKRLRVFAKAHAAWGRLTSQYPATFAQWRWTSAHWRYG
jgi:RNA-directed DNA polymerase